eukprot:m.21834 g.21834  ORF g.21834 m.21834 type:complete len:75 (+) comp28230_c0_seq2:124-348(+)
MWRIHIKKGGPSQIQDLEDYSTIFYPETLLDFELREDGSLLRFLLFVVLSFDDASQYSSTRSLDCLNEGLDCLR